MVENQRKLYRDPYPDKVFFQPSKIKVPLRIFSNFCWFTIQEINISIGELSWNSLFNINKYFSTNEYWFWGSEKDVDVKMFFKKGRLLRWSIIKDLVSTIIILSKFLLHWNVEHFIVYCLEFSKFWNWTSTKNFISNAVYVFQC